MNDLLVTDEQVALRRENANVFLLKFAHTRVSLLSSIDINMTTTTTTRRRKQKRSSSSSLHSSSSSSSAPSSSSSPSRRAMMTLLLLLFGTISDVFVVRATWPIVRYKNGTVGVKNDGGTVKVEYGFNRRRKLERFWEFIHTRSRSRGVRGQSVVSRDSFRGSGTVKPFELLFCHISVTDCISEGGH